MSGNYFGAYTPGGQYNTLTTPAFAGAPYGFTPAAAGYATAFPPAPPPGSRSDIAYAYASTSDTSGYAAGNAPNYAAPMTPVAGGVPGSVVPGFGNSSKSGLGPTGATGPPSKPPSASTGASYTGYDAAVYAAATSYLQSKAVGGTSNWLGMKRGNSSSSSMSTSFGSTGPVFTGGRGSFPRKVPPSPRTLQLHYCEICKISCAGPQTYKEHLEGQKHKKKAALAQGETSQPLAKTKLSFRCDLCNTTCTGQDTYNAHVRGSKHQRTLKLHQTLGKPIPTGEPTVIAPPGIQKSADGAGGVKKIIGVPKVAFVGGQKLTTTGLGQTGESVEDETEDSTLFVEKDVQPVGEDYVELVKSEDGKTVQYFCKLCSCRFNDMNAKDMHLKGRRHRLQFKKKVNPSLEVEMKTPIKGRRSSDDRRKGYQSWGSSASYHTPMPFGAGPMPVPLFASAGVTSRQASLTADLDDQYVMAKHALIYPSDEEMKAVMKMVTNVERALKTISDHFAEGEKEEKEEGKVKEEMMDDGDGQQQPAVEPKANSAVASEERLLKGAMRVGPLSSGLLLRGDPRVQLVVLCSEKPTVTLLKKVADLLPQHLAAVTGDSYDVEADASEAEIKVDSVTEKITVAVALTSVLIRETPAGGEAANKPDPIDILDKTKCLEALASLRHAKWFQAKCANLQSCAIVLRIFRDLCQRLATWMPLSTWALELMVEKVLNSVGVPLSPGEAFRRMFEAIAGGILLPGGPGLQDPCEKETTDAATELQSQQREDITASAQHALRLIAFKQMYMVLGIEKSAIRAQSTQRKRPLEPIGSAEENGNGKKDKKDATMEVDQGTTDGMEKTME